MKNMSNKNAPYKILSDIKNKIEKKLKEDTKLLHLPLATQKQKQ